MSRPESSQTLDALAGDAGRLGLALDERAHARFGRFLELVLEWTPRAGLTSITDPRAVQHRLFGESLALLPVLREAGALDGETVGAVDIGSGAGIPGLALRIVEPALRLTLLDASARRCRFLELVVEELELDHVRVVHTRAEDAGRGAELRASFDLALARAVAPMPVLVEYALPLLRRGGLLAAPKGSRAQEELVAAAGALAALGGSAGQPVPLPLPADAPPQYVLLVRRTGELDDRYPRRAGIPAKRPLR